MLRPDLYLNSLLSSFSIEQTSSADKDWNNYLAAEENILNDQLPHKVKAIFDHKCPFYDDELLFLKRKKKKCERLYRKTRSVDLKADFDLNTKMIPISFLKKRALFINNVWYGKCTGQKYALLKTLLGKEEQILRKCENKEVIAKDFNKFFVSKVGNIIASIQAAECPEILPLTNKLFCAFNVIPEQFEEATYGFND